MYVDTELSEQGGDRRLLNVSSPATFDVKYKKSNNLAILSNDTAFTSMFPIK